MMALLRNPEYGSPQGLRLGLSWASPGMGTALAP